jgi:hypothetical protein
MGWRRRSRAAACGRNNGWYGSIVKNFGVWGLAVVLAIELAACGGDWLADPPKLVLEPGGGFKAEIQEGVKASLKIQGGISADAALIQAEVTLENGTGDVVTVTVPRPCDVHDWVIREVPDKLVMTKGSIECVDQPATKALASGNLTEQIFIYLLPRVLVAGRHYVVEYRFWGQPARAEFIATR